MSKNILIIDDEELVTKSLIKLLQKQGYDAVMAKSGKEALVKIKEINFDLIVSDVRMPDMDGIEVIKNIRDQLKQSRKKPIPEILITGYADIEKYESAMALKVQEYLYKPFDNDKFLQVVRNCIG